MKTIRIPYNSIVLLIGPSNSGKSTTLENWINKGFLQAEEVISSDHFRKLVSNIDFVDWTNQPKEVAANLMEEYSQISTAAFEMMKQMISARATLNKRSYIDATHLKEAEREKYRLLGKKYHVPVVVIVFDLSLSVLLERDEKRTHPRGKGKVKRQFEIMRQEIRKIQRESYHAIYYIRDRDESVSIETEEASYYLNADNGLDIIGDIHGCMDECYELLERLGYIKHDDGLYRHPEGRKFVSVGDIMSRGPKSAEALFFFSAHLNHNLAYMIDSNHGWKIARWLDGKKVTLNHGDEWIKETFTSFSLTYTDEQIEKIREDWKTMLLQSPSHYVLTRNGVKTAVVAHAGIKDHYIGKQSNTISDFTRYGETLGMDTDGKPIRGDWYRNHLSKELIIWGHDPKPEPLFVNNTINIDQGVVFGGKLTAFRYPEREFISVKAQKDYAQIEDNPLKKWQETRLSLPNVQRFINGYSVWTDTFGEISCPQNNVKAAMDKVSHFTIPMEELIYIPPTMSPPSQTSTIEGYLEHPIDAYHYYKDNGIDQMVVEKKHMGSRGILLLFKNPEAAEKYVGKRSLGTIYTRTGRAFFSIELEEKILTKLHYDLTTVNYFDKNQTDWVLLDAEILPWNLKAKDLIIQQYAHVAEMSVMDRDKIYEQLLCAQQNGMAVNGWVEEFAQKRQNAQSFSEVYNQYCWEIQQLEDIKIAPFHILAHSNESYFHQTHQWHMEQNEYFSTISSLFMKTDYLIVNDDESLKKAVSWWEEITTDGHEGVIFKPYQFLARNPKGKLLQPAIKVRGRKYLQIIYGMDYLEKDQLRRLKDRKTAKKQRNALKELALGIEGINRFIQLESVERIHECVLATLALEEDPIDARL
ncbi:polynucleotide kinase-phosphatase [Niallia circulans]|uniref:polynucleotide kinase-phosphatase n=1 Tax=Niallia circulans TaxID=1397 RepID=UPI003D98703C